MDETPNPFDLTGKSALITGASKGIGKAIAWMLGRHGAKVVISSRNQESLDQVSQEFATHGIDCLGISAKIGDAGSMKQLVERSLEQCGTIDILVNNAAANPVFGPVINTEEGAFDKIMEVNLKGPFLLSKMLYPGMKAKGEGSIINISSVGGISPEHFLGIYSVSKAALISLSKVLAKEWGSDGIRVNVICPGLIKTKFSATLWKNEDILKKVLKNQSLPHIGQPEDLGAIALVLASRAGAYCTGGVYTVDGGYTI